MQEVDCSYYVYLYLKPDRTPFYVGKGKDGRWKRHIREAKRDKTRDKNNLKLNTIRKILKSGQEPIVKFVDSNISEEQAFELEQFLISEIGRIDLGTGTLTNLTDGGEGQSGYVYSEKHIEELRIKFSGENNPNYGKRGELCPWYGRKHTEETKLKMSEKRTGVSKSTKGKPSPLSKEDLNKLKELLIERNQQIVTCPYCGRVGKYVGMIRWHLENCKEKNNVASK